MDTSSNLDAVLEGLGLDNVPDIDHEALHNHSLQVSSRHSACLSCGGSHRSQVYILCERIKRGCWTIENTDAFCRARIVLHGELLDEAIAPVLAHPSPGTFPGLFLLGHVGTLWCSPDGARVARWTGERWRMMASLEWNGYIAHWLGSLLMAIARSEVHADVEEQVSRAVMASGRWAGRTRAIIVSKLICLSAGITMDDNPLLLGGEGNLLELDTGLVRAQRLDDYVTKSVGYRLQLEPSEEHVLRLEALLEKIYPMGEERRLVQQFAGYCLRGDHPGEDSSLLWRSLFSWLELSCLQPSASSASWGGVPEAMGKAPCTGCCARCSGTSTAAMARRSCCTGGVPVDPSTTTTRGWPLWRGCA